MVKKQSEGKARSTKWSEGKARSKKWSEDRQGQRSGVRIGKVKEVE
jgi:hypothetical protein